MSGVRSHISAAYIRQRISLLCDSDWRSGTEAILTDFHRISEIHQDAFLHRLWTEFHVSQRAALPSRAR